MVYYDRKPPKMSTNVLFGPTDKERDEEEGGEVDEGVLDEKEVSYKWLEILHEKCDQTLVDG